MRDQNHLTPPADVLTRLGLLCAGLALCALTAAAGPPGSAAYTLPAEALDSAGNAGTSAAYSLRGNLGDLAGSGGSASFGLMSGFLAAAQDTAPPTLGLPSSPVSIQTTNPAGAVVNFTVSATDEDGDALTAACSPPSGSLFPVGNTTVTVTATDLVGNTATGTFTVNVTLLSVVQSWRQQYFGTTASTGDAADTADPFNTGVPNLLAFAFFGPNQNPALVSVSQLPQLQMSEGNLIYTFTEPTGIGGVTYGAEWTTTLDPPSWQPVADSGTAPAHTFVVPISGNGEAFVRLTVTDP